jgi:hypothetical protein
MADEHAAGQTPLLADVLPQLAIRDRLALVQQLNDSLTHVRVVAEGVCGAVAPPPLTLPQVEAHLQAAIQYLESAGDVLRLQSEGRGADDAQRG